MQVPSDRVGYGLNRDTGVWRDDRYYRCAKCGHVCHLDRDQRAPDGSRLGYGVDLASNTFHSYATGHMSGERSAGWGIPALNTGDTSTGSIWSSTVAVVRINPVVTKGCPFCGSYRFDLY